LAEKAKAHDGEVYINDLNKKLMVNPMPTVFISYSTHDSSLARCLVDSLSLRGVNCWFAERSIKPGDNYSSSIIRGLELSDYVLLIFTRNSNASPEVHKEIERASTKRIPVIPIRFDDEKYHPALEYHLGVAQWVIAIDRQSEDVEDELASFLLGQGKFFSGADSFKTNSASNAHAKKEFKNWYVTIVAVAVIIGIYFGISDLDPSGTHDIPAKEVKVLDSVRNPTKVISVASTLAPTSTEIRVAVLYFDNTNKSPELEGLRKGFADMLISDMNGKAGLVLVEREKLEDVLKELKLQTDKAFDSASVVKLGKLLGVEFLVTGSFFELMGQFRVDAKAVNIETGIITATAGVSGTKEEFMQIERNIADTLITAVTGKNPEKHEQKHYTYVELQKYSQVLGLIDIGDLKQAKQKLKRLVDANPKFQLAVDLARKVGA